MWTIEYEVSNLVASHRGTMPLLIACPHGGDAEPPGVEERNGSDTPADCNFEKSSDRNTREIVEGVAQRMLDVFGEAPYVVIAGWDRDYIDANRSRRCAFEMDAAAPFYDEYHATLRDFIDEIRAENGGLGLLFDTHGTASEEADVFLGTANGETVARLLAADPLALFRRRSLRGYIEAAGHAVSPAQRGDPEAPRFSGGFTVREYGSSHADGLDAIQLEITARLRNDAEQRRALIDVLAYAFGNLVRHWADSPTFERGRHVVRQCDEVLALPSPTPMAATSARRQAKI